MKLEEARIANGRLERLVDGRWIRCECRMGGRDAEGDFADCNTSCTALSVSHSTIHQKCIDTMFERVK